MASPHKKTTRAARGRKNTLTKLVRANNVAESAPSNSMPAPSGNSFLPLSSFIDDEASVSDRHAVLSSDEDDGRPGPDDHYELDGFVVADDVNEV
ncbi:hypothetical protein EV360DRAFT_81769 [Lentinula raphanica]|nr:hypothetical protein EV360DRAFT_81769 [Lentinula raphanica]